MVPPYSELHADLETCLLLTHASGATITSDRERRRPFAVNDSDCCCGYTHEMLLYDKVRQMEVTLTLGTTAMHRMFHVQGPVAGQTVTQSRDFSYSQREEVVATIAESHC